MLTVREVVIAGVCDARTPVSDGSEANIASTKQVVYIVEQPSSNMPNLAAKVNCQVHA